MEYFTSGTEVGWTFIVAMLYTMFCLFVVPFVIVLLFRVICDMVREGYSHTKGYKSVEEEEEILKKFKKEDKTWLEFADCARYLCSHTVLKDLGLVQRTVYVIECGSLAEYKAKSHWDLDEFIKYLRVIGESKDCFQRDLKKYYTAVEELKTVLERYKSILSKVDSFKSGVSFGALKYRHKIDDLLRSQFWLVDERVNYGKKLWVNKFDGDSAEECHVEPCHEADAISFGFRPLGFSGIPEYKLKLVVRYKDKSHGGDGWRKEKSLGIEEVINRL